MSCRYAALVALFTLAAGAYAQEAPSFNWDVRPILSNNCYACHGPDDKQRKADLHLGDPASVFNDGREGGPPIVRGNANASELVERITSTDPNLRMPPPEAGEPLTPAQIDVLKRWIEAGAEYQPHWSFIKPTQPEAPEVTGEWPRNAVDAFVLTNLHVQRIQPSAEADRRTLIRRVYLDLIGLPPGLDEMDAFIEDERPDAYERVVDQLLESPHFGERWGRHWLDAARYADSNGYSIDAARTIWPYRDWVINAINNDMPFDQFVIEQMAGDLLPDATREQRVATGFHRNTMINEEGGVDEEEFRVAAVIDRVNTVGNVFFGLTLACAQCHTHKFDPITHDEYFRLFAFLTNDDEPTTPYAPDEEIASRDRQRAELELLKNDFDAFCEEALPRWRASLDLATLTEEQRAAVSRPDESATPEQKEEIVALFLKLDEEARSRNQKVKQFERQIPKLPETMVLAPRAEPRVTRLLIQGDYTRPGEPVTPGVPAVLHPIDPNASSTRLDLARWIVDPENPLTARVTVNRFWQSLFGKGIVETENDFGTQGIAPTNPELLDWLAVEFVESGWNMKHIIRTMITSATYRQLSRPRNDLRIVDPGNRLLARQARLRLDAEIIRDSALVVSGLFHPAIGGPSVFPPQPDGVMTLGQQSRPWKASTGGDRYRRGMYTHFWRATPHPALLVFDASDATTACTRRMRSNTPLQALTMLNDPAIHEMAVALADRLRNREGTDVQRLHFAFKLCLARDPTARELEILRGLLESDSGETDSDPWLNVARTMLNLDEFITRE